MPPSVANGHTSSIFPSRVSIFHVCILVVFEYRKTNCGSFFFLIFSMTDETLYTFLASCLEWAVVLHWFTHSGSVGHNSESLRKVIKYSGLVRGAVKSLSTTVWRSGRSCGTTKFGITSSVPRTFHRDQ